jgi:hypothetical protein
MACFRNKYIYTGSCQKFLKHATEIEAGVVYMYSPSFARQRLGKIVAAKTNTHAKTEGA